MSTGRTFQSEVKFNDKYYGVIDESADFFSDQSILNLIERWNDDIDLRRLFVDFTFPMIFDIHNCKEKKEDRKEDIKLKSNLFEFVRATSGHLHIKVPSLRNDILKFFVDMRIHADKVFQGKIKRDCDRICVKAEELGLLEPKTSVVFAKGIISFMPSEAYNPGLGEEIAIFYKISSALFELWVKPSTKGKMLEVWVYNILESNFKDRNVIILPCVKLHTHYEGAEEAKKISDLVASYDTASKYQTARHELTELDCIILDKRSSTVIAIIECKTGNDTGESELLQLYGKMALLSVYVGVLIVGNKSTFRSDQEFEKIRIIPNAVDRPDFPKILVDYLDTKLKEMGI